MPPRVKAGGVGQYFNPEGAMVEVHTKKCQHCGCLVEFPSMKKFHQYMDICRSCGGAHCLKESCLQCTPLMKKIEQGEEAFYRRQQLSKIMGLD